MNDVPRSFRGNSNAARDIAHHLHPYTNFKKHEETGPLTIVRGRGIYVTDDDGKEYIEGMAGLWSAALGFSNERLATVAYEQMKQLPFYHAFNHRSHEPAINLAEKLKTTFPVASRLRSEKIGEAKTGFLVKASDWSATALKLFASPAIETVSVPGPDSPY